MSEQLPQKPEALLELQYKQGWQEILEAEDAEEYRSWIDNLVELTQQMCANDPSAPEWAAQQESVKNRWQRAIEVVGEGALETDDLTEAERIETGLLTIKENIESMGWETEGLAFMTVGSEPYIDLRDLPTPPGANNA